VTTAIRHEALPQGKSKKTTNSAAARETSAVGRQLGSLRTARAIASGASTPSAMINKNAMPCTQPFQVLGLPPLSIAVVDPKRGQHQCHPKQCEQHDREAARPSAPQLITRRRGSRSAGP
jgi:hypothetical protein